MLWFLIHVCIFLAIVVLTQSAHIFPGALFSIFNSRARDPKTLPDGVDSAFIETEDGKSLEVWRYAASADAQERPEIALIFHGNGAAMENFVLVQYWFASLGITSYAFDYRGFGKSSGWPSEKGLELDSDAFWHYVMSRESVDASKVIVFGISVGGAPASRIAAKHKVNTLVLVSAFTRIKDVVSEQFLVGLFAPFIWFRLPTIENVATLESTNLLLLHGAHDSLVGPHHSEDLRKAYCGNGTVELLMADSAGHNTVFFVERQLLAEKLLSIV